MLYMKKLYRSKTNRMWAGVCGGIGEYFDIDPTVVRIGWLVVMILTGLVPMVLAYIIGILLIPERT